MPNDYPPKDSAGGAAYYREGFAAGQASRQEEIDNLKAALTVSSQVETLKLLRQAEDALQLSTAAFLNARAEIDRLTIPADWSPTAAAINVLPDPVRSFIHQLETAGADRAGDTQERIVLRDIVKAQEAEIDTLKQELGLLRPTNSDVIFALVKGEQHATEKGSESGDDQREHPGAGTLENETRAEAEPQAKRGHRDVV